MKFLSMLFIFSVVIINFAFAGKLKQPNDMQYPNILPPELQFGGILDELSSDLGKIEDIAYLENNILLISESTTHSVIKVIMNGDDEKPKLENFVSTQVKFPKGLYVWDKKVALIDEGNKKLRFYDISGKEIGHISIENMYAPWDVAISKQKAFITDNQKSTISVFNIKTGKHIRDIESFGDSKISLPLGISSNGDFLVFADSGNNQLVKFDAEYNLIHRWGSWGTYGGQMATPYNLDISEEFIYLADQINHRLQVFDYEGNFLYQWARHPPTAHEGNGRVHYPTSIAVNPSGTHVTVCEVIENRCQVFGGEVTDGLVAKVDDSAWWVKATKFHYGARPEIVANMLTVSEPDTHSILVFKLEEKPRGLIFPKFITRLGGQGKEPGKLIQPSGTLINVEEKLIWVSDRGNLRMQQYSYSEAPLPITDKELSTQKLNPKMSMGSGSGKFIKQIDLRKQEQKIFKSKLGNEAPAIVGEPSAMVRLNNGNILMVDPMLGKVNIFNEKMTLIGSWGELGKKDHQLLKPLDIDVSPDQKRIYIVDEYAFKIKVFSIDGKFLFSWGGPGIEPGNFVTPFGITIDSEGNVFISDTAKNEIKKFTKDGEYLLSWGGWGVKPGEFYKPKGLAIDSKDRIVVMDFGNHRGQIFDNNGTFIEMFGISETPQIVSREIE